MVYGPVCTARARRAYTLASEWERVVLITPQSREYFYTRKARQWDPAHEGGTI